MTASDSGQELFCQVAPFDCYYLGPDPNRLHLLTRNYKIGPEGCVPMFRQTVQNRPCVNLKRQLIVQGGLDLDGDMGQTEQVVHLDQKGAVTQVAEDSVP